MHKLLPAVVMLAGCYSTHVVDRRFIPALASGFEVPTHDGDPISLEDNAIAIRALAGTKLVDAGQDRIIDVVPANADGGWESAPVAHAGPVRLVVTPGYLAVSDGNETYFYPAGAVGSVHVKRYEPARAAAIGTGTALGVAVTVAGIVGLWALRCGILGC